ncbi:CSC1-like protein HYP1 isoform X3 [Selaginella moellendorffii]|uniref:CSC1-like protein HYP1 isoform X3 n=1 Tax=Selaginella moellendorffii TaxID=88036 RepID=UPI000D1D03CD|nr:CSC1-like protein HYP1 isoform X3 [Selaginella moellendorffii]|eukprot:XP_024525748.1 CSC1-like protein HYP1 isoform X3 [Selaginella moellendorffii]
MQLGGLVASAGINIGLAVIFYSLYSIFRKQRTNVNVYFPRYVLRQKNVFKTDRFKLASLVPSAGWIQRALQPSEEEIIASCGLDAAVLLRIFIFSMRFFAICTLIGVGILAPLNYTDNQVSHASQIGLLFDSLDLFTISNISNGSNRLWIHLAALYVISFSAYWLLHMEYKHVTQKRLEVLSTARPQPDQYTVLVRSIPRESQEESYSASIDRFFSQYHPHTYLSHQMVIRDWRVVRKKQTLESLVKEIERLKQIAPHERPTCRDGWLGLFGSKVDQLEFKSRKFEELFDDFREGQRELQNNGEAELPSAFVSFKSRWGAAMAAQTQQAENPMAWVTDYAGFSEPKNIPNQLAIYVPRQSTFFITYILTTGWTGFSTEILQLGIFLLNFIKVRILGKTTFDETDTISLPYYRALPSVLLFILLGLMYAVLAPLLLPFLLIYLVFGYIVYRNQVLFVYEPSYETSGQFWPHVHSSVIFALVLMQITFIGVFGVKQKPNASILTIFLPFITLFFDNYCKSRFVPIFANLSMETTMKKDTEDEKSGAKDELLQCIQGSYKHPALQSLDLRKSDADDNTDLLLPETPV